MCQYITFTSIMGDCDVVNEANKFLKEHPNYRIITTNISSTGVHQELIIGYEVATQIAKNDENSVE